jgi:hypothetical protein
LPDGHAEDVENSFIGREYGGGFKTAVDQAVFATGIIARSEAVPIGYVDELAVGEVMGVAA